MLFRHYKGLATKDEAEKWFNVLPHMTAMNIVPMAVVIQQSS